MHQFQPSYHFDGSQFQETATNINALYSQVLTELAADFTDGDFDRGSLGIDSHADDAAEYFGMVVHAAQDFYAHSNWVESQQQGLIRQDTLLNRGLSTWDTLAPYSTQAGAYLVEGEDQNPTVGGQSATLTRNGFTVNVAVGNSNRPGIISGSTNPLIYLAQAPDGDNTPDSVAISHGGTAGNRFLETSRDLPRGLAKDSAGDTSESQTAYAKARQLAGLQTRHEVVRLFNMVEQDVRLGPAAREALINAWVGPANSAQRAEFNRLFVQAAGKTGDVFKVDLADYWSRSRSNAQAVTKFDLYGVDVVTTTGRVLPAQLAPTSRNGEWTVQVDGIAAGTLLQSERLETGSPSFASTGRFYLAPSTANGVPGDQASGTGAAGFQGQIVVSFRATEQGATSSTLAAIPILISSGYSSSSVDKVVTPADANDKALNIARVQQRLNFLGETDFENKPLVVDGILGPRTSSALGKLMQLSADSPDLFARPTIDRLNAITLPTEKDRAIAASGLRATETKVKASANELLEAPLPLVGNAATATAVGGNSVNLSNAANSGQVSLASALDLDRYLSQTVFGSLADYIETTAAPTQAGLESWLTSRGQSGLTSFTTIASSPGQTNLFRYHAVFTRSVAEPKSLRLGADAVAQGISLSGNVDVTLTTSATIDVEFGLDTSKADPSEAFFFKLNNLTATASAQVLGDLSVDALGRFLELDVTGSSLSLAATVSLSAPQRTAKELLETADDAIFQVQGTTHGEVNGSLDVSVKGSAGLFGGTYSGTIGFSDPDIFDSTPLTVSADLPTLAGLSNLVKLDGSSLQFGISQLGTAIDNLRGSTLLEQGVGLTSLKLADVLDFKGAGMHVLPSC